MSSLQRKRPGIIIIMTLCSCNRPVLGILKGGSGVHNQLRISRMISQEINVAVKQILSKSPSPRTGMCNHDSNCASNSMTFDSPEPPGLGDDGSVSMSLLFSPVLSRSVVTLIDRPGCAL